MSSACPSVVLYVGQQSIPHSCHAKLLSDSRAKFSSRSRRVKRLIMLVAVACCSSTVTRARKSHSRLLPPSASRHNIPTPTFRRGQIKLRLSGPGVNLKVSAPRTTPEYSFSWLSPRSRGSILPINTQTHSNRTNSRF